MSKCTLSLKVLLIVCFLPCLSLASEKVLPVDVSFLIVDTKWHETRGAQVCEIQHGVLSAFRGYRMLYGEKEQIAEKVIQILNGYFDKSWVCKEAFADPGLKEKFSKDSQWSCFHVLKNLENEKKFLFSAVPPPKDFSSLKDYRGFVFHSPHIKMDREEFRSIYPGVVMIDNAFDGYEGNKYKMSQLLLGDTFTEAHKPLWKHYDKNEENLAERILEDFQSDLLVIKPLKEYCGKGVIILKREDLKKTLESMLDVKNKNEKDLDPAYRYWRKAKSSEFIVEEFIESEPIFVPHLEKTYIPTMRLVFLLFYDNGKIQIDCLGGYYNLPSISLEEGGSLNEICKSASTLPYFGKVEPELLKEAEAQIKEVLHIIYKKLLGL